MSNRNKSIYKHKNGRNISHKKLYKLPSKHSGQKGGGIMDSIGSFFKGGEIPGSPAVDGDGNVVDVENDTNDKTSDNNEVVDKVSDEEVVDKVADEEDEVVDNDENEVVDNDENENDNKTPNEEESTGVIQGIRDTVGQSLSATASEVKDYMTQPKNEEELSELGDDSDNGSLMEPSSTNIQVPCDELLEENKKLREKIDELQEEIKAILKKDINRLESREPSFSQDSSNISPIETNSSSENYMSMDSPDGMSQTSSNDNMDISPDPLDKTSVESTSPMEISPLLSNTESNGSFGNQTSMDVSPDENVGGTKRRKKKNRKTKRKRNKRVSFQ